MTEIDKKNLPLQIHWCHNEEISLVNEEYKKINFKLSSLQTDRVAIATFDGVFAGLGRLCYIQDTIFELGGMHVDQKYRGLGIARKILQFLLESICLKTTVYCLPFAHLKKFYQSEGFELVAQDAFADVPMEILEKHRWCNETYPYEVLLLKLKSSGERDVGKR